MNDSHIVSLRQVEENVSIVPLRLFHSSPMKKRMNGSVKFLDRFGYNKEDSSKKEKTSIRRYIKKYTEYSRSQITRLIKEKKETSTLKYGKGKKRNRFKKSTPRKMPNFRRSGQCLSENVRRRHEKSV